MLTLGVPQNKKAFSLEELKMSIPLNKVNSKHVLENWECRIMAQVLCPSGPSVHATGSPLSKLNRGEPLMGLIFSCALVSPNSRGITFWWELKTEWGGGGIESHPPEDGGHTLSGLEAHLYSFRIVLHQVIWWNQGEGSFAG